MMPTTATPPTTIPIIAAVDITVAFDGVGVLVGFEVVVPVTGRVVAPVTGGVVVPDTGRLLLPGNVVWVVRSRLSKTVELVMCSVRIVGVGVVRVPPLIGFGLYPYLAHSPTTRSIALVASAPEHTEVAQEENTLKNSDAFR